MRKIYPLFMILSINFIFTGGLAEAGESFEPKPNASKINAFVFKKTKSIIETVKTNTTPQNLNARTC